MPSGKTVSTRCGRPRVDGIAHVELPVFEQGNKATAETEEISGADHESLQKMLEVAAGAEFGRDLKQLVQFVRLALRCGTKFGVSDGNCTEAGDGRDTSDFSSAVKLPS